MKKDGQMAVFLQFRAGDEIRTREIQLGMRRGADYQLSNSDGH